MGSREGTNEMRWDQGRRHHKRLLISGNKLRVARGEGVRRMGWLGDGH